MRWPWAENFWRSAKLMYERECKKQLVWSKCPPPHQGKGYHIWLIKLFWKAAHVNVGSCSVKSQVISQSMMSWNETDRNSFNLSTEDNAILCLDKRCQDGRRSVSSFVWYLAIVIQAWPVLYKRKWSNTCQGIYFCKNMAKITRMAIVFSRIFS